MSGSTAAGSEAVAGLAGSVPLELELMRATGTRSVAKSSGVVTDVAGTGRPRWRGCKILLCRFLVSGAGMPGTCFTGKLVSGIWNLVCQNQT